MGGDGGCPVEFGVEVGPEVVEVPVVGVGAVGVEPVLGGVLYGVGDEFLCCCVDLLFGCGEDGVSVVVHAGALCVEDVVVFEGVFALGAVLSVDVCLCFGDAFGEGVSGEGFVGGGLHDGG